ncbi:restriction endonuclease subunit S [Stutzerimonas stutzeri]|uniref:restriction endonuclease subunit S n=1 Tax=Stutzerimonas stutzeri TaxID=316 RepID=UPI000F78F361|nr:restriction endonuclease subunit S [Stutzerimonas stutzeri]RRV30830.1 restriction endonuclease subunit S [Stutzerimonas stutzeri]CAB5559413.1 EcoKI restriction-modification system protein HsdS [Stutzerimonas stutzeri]CAB5601711.1 EcoKI restriction-modification system protein HsdS [Stutzerimonas stutzeri]CAC9083327.1 EcoKI restriction-modification system protein HsdS [Stutzerimonas stutzeri]
MSSDSCRLADIADIQGGYAFKSADFGSSGVAVVKIANIQPPNVVLDAADRVEQHKLEGLTRFELADGDILMAMTGATVGKVARLRKTERAFLNQRVARISAKDDPELNDFIYALVSQPGFDKQIQSAAAGSAQANISAAGIGAVVIPSLDRDTQLVIGSIARSIDDRITLLRETNATLEAIAKALFKSWFVDFDPVRAKAEGRQPEGMDATTAALFPDSFEESELGLVPRGWGVVPFLDACDLQGGAQPPAATFIDEPRDGYVRLLQIRDFSTDAHKTYIPDTGKLKKVTEDDVLIGRYGSASGDKAKDSLGRVCRGLSGSYNVALMKLCPVQVGREYALQLVSDSSFYGYLQGVSSKAVQSGFSKAELGQYKVIMPPSDLAEAFEQFGKAVWERVKANRELAQTLTQLRDTLLPRLISGQLRLPEAESLLENAL